MIFWKWNLCLACAVRAYGQVCTKYTYLVGGNVTNFKNRKSAKSLHPIAQCVKGLNPEPRFSVLRQIFVVISEICFLFHIWRSWVSGPIEIRPSFPSQTWMIFKSVHYPILEHMHRNMSGLGAKHLGNKKDMFRCLWNA